MLQAPSLFSAPFTPRVVPCRYWTCKYQPVDLPRAVEMAVSGHFDRLERSVGPVVVGHAARYLSAAYSGLSEMELLDLMSCNNDVLEATIPLVTDADGCSPLLRFPYHVWLELRTGFGELPVSYAKRSSIYA